MLADSFREMIEKIHPSKQPKAFRIVQDLAVKIMKVMDVDNSGVLEVILNSNKFINA
jgi:hypothetical protein